MSQLVTTLYINKSQGVLFSTTVANWHSSHYYHNLVSHFETRMHFATVELSILQHRVIHFHTQQKCIFYSRTPLLLPYFLTLQHFFAKFSQIGTVLAPL